MIMQMNKQYIYALMTEQKREIHLKVFNAMIRLKFRMSSIAHKGQ